MQYYYLNFYFFCVKKITNCVHFDKWKINIILIAVTELIHLNKRSSNLALQLHVQNEVQVFISILFLGTSWSELFYC